MTNKLDSGVLVVALGSRGSLAAAHELLTAGRSLADTLKERLSAVLLGRPPAEAARDLVERGADKVFVLEHEALSRPDEELQAAALVQLCQKERFGKILFPSSVAGRSLAARLSVKLKAAIATDVFALDAGEAGLKVRRAGYGGNIIGEVEFASPSCVMTLQGMVWPPAPKTPGRAGQVEAVAFAPSATRTEFVSSQAQEAGEIDLGGADLVVSGGRGLGSPEGFKPVRALAKALGAAVGASRAAVDAGWIPYRHQVGLTGRTIRPKLYMACGISGQIQHLAGMSSAKTIVAINSDPECPMMKAATLAVAGDVHEILPLVTGEIMKRRGAAVA
ncbi:MAG: electron transfer flavoprotein subunit alpha/FixB family protein [Elusimicrobia bacterium]|nr:electron transfer flavoprotein subunit alpha/FixB family protein [Elusimicrobiota bacterium]